MSKERKNEINRGESANVRALEKQQQHFGCNSESQRTHTRAKKMAMKAHTVAVNTAALGT